jgi:hypothetical protein
VSNLRGEGFNFTAILDRGEVDLAFSGANLCFFDCFSVGARLSLFFVFCNFVCIRIT